MVTTTRINDFKTLECKLGAAQPTLAFLLGCKLGAVRNKLKQLRKRKILPIETIIINELKFHEDVYFHKKPNAVTPYGQYYYSIHDAVEGVCELNERQMAEVDKIWFYKRLALIELGVEYSSNNAGDGPGVFEYFTKSNNNEALDYAESCVLLATGLIKSKDKTDFVLALLNFAKGRHNGSLIQNNDFVENIMQYYTHIFYHEERLQSENIFTDMRNYLKDFDAIKKSDIFKKFYRILMYSISFSLFGDKDMAYNTFGYTVLEQEAIRKNFSSRSDFTYTILDTVTFICEKGYQIYQSGEISNIFHEERRYIEWFNKAEKLKRESKFCDQNPDFKESLFLSELEQVIEKGDSIMRYGISMGRYERDSVSNYLNELKMAQCDYLTKKRARSNRDCPLAILINGDTSIGKSSIVEILRVQYGKVNGMDCDSCTSYTRNPVANFWDGFTSSIWCCKMDDVAFMKTTAASTGDPSCLEFLQVINAVPFVPDQANLADKGRTPFLCELVLATTNTKNLNSNFYFSCPSAVQRRFPYVITPTVKKELRKDNTFMLDSSKTVPVEGSYPDNWLFKVEKVVPAALKVGNNQSLATFELIKDDIGIVELMIWYNEVIKNHKKNTQIVADSLNNLVNIDLCNICYLPKNDCVCIQSLPVDMVSYFIKFWMYIGIHSICYSIGFYLTFWFLDFLRFWPIFRRRVRARLGSHFVQFSLRNLGRRAYASFNPPKMLALIAITIGISYKTWRYFSLINQVQAGKEDENDGVKPTPSNNDKREPIWYKNDYELTTFDVSRSTLSSKALDESQIIKIFGKNCVSLKVHAGINEIIPVKAFGIGGQLYLTNNHAIPVFKEQLRITVTQQNMKDGVTTNQIIYISNNDIKRFSHKDLCLIIIRSLPPKKDLTDYFAKSSFEPHTHGMYIQRNRDGDITSLKVSNIKKNFGATISKINIVLDVWEGVPEMMTENGDCGSILMMKSEYGYVVAGLHMLFHDKYSVALSIDQNDIEICKEFGKNYFVDVSAPILQSASVRTSIVSLHPKSTIRYINNGHANVYGSFVGFRAKHKSRVVETPMLEFMLAEGYSLKQTVPVFDWRPWRLAAMDSLNIPTNMNTEILDYCVESFINDIQNNLHEGSLSILEKYDDFTAINGAEGINYVDKISRNTSAGFPWRKNKKFFLKAIPQQHGLMDPVDIDDEIKDMRDKYMDLYKQNSCAAPVFCSHLKDEPISFKKREAGKTRVFSGANLPWTIIVRKYFLSSIRLIQENKYAFEAAPGIIAQCSEWEHLYEYLTKHGKEQMVAGDFAKYDKSMSPTLILASFQILIELSKISGNFSEEDLSIMKAISFDVAFAYQDFNGDLVQFFGQNPSGHPLTVIINCLANSLYMRYSYTLQNPEKECLSFKDNCNLMTYGDDNIMGISKTIPWFNHTTISHQLSLIGVKYTMADKEAISVPYIHIDETSFLKRTFRFDKDIGRVVAPLDHSSIEKMLTIWVRSKTITEEEQCIAIISSAIREYFFYGKIEFESKRLMFQRLIFELNLQPYVEISTLPHYSDLLQEYNQRSAIADEMRSA